MRRTVLTGLITVIALAGIAAPAAAFDRHFSVVEKTTSFHDSKDSFRFTDALVAPFDQGNRVGRDKATCSVGPNKLQCEGMIYLNGELGGHGSIHIEGNVGGHDTTLNVVGGAGGFSGVTGKVILGGPSNSHLHFHVIR